MPELHYTSLDLNRDRSGTTDTHRTDPSQAPPPSNRADPPKAPIDPEVAAAEEVFAVAAAARDAAVRKVRIAELVQGELPDDAKESAQADAEDKLLSTVAKYEAADRALDRARASLERVRAVAAQPVPDDDPVPDDGPATMYTDADDWLRSWLLPTWRRGDRRWCAKWWLHAEAVSRIEAIWRAWEALRLDGTLGPSVWWRDHADYHLAVLTGSDGPFARCSHEKSRHQLIDPLTAVPNPAKLADFLDG